MVFQASSVLLTLADGRFPAGGHAHSGGLEEAVASGRVRNGHDLHMFLAGRLETVGRVEAAFTALSCSVAPSPEGLAFLDVELAARSPSPAMRAASRAQGRRLLRAARAVWPGASLEFAFGPASPTGPMFPIALGAVGQGVGLGTLEVALIAAQSSVNGPAWAATKLLGVDPFAVVRCLSCLASAIEEVATVAGTCGYPRASWTEAPSRPPEVPNLSEVPASLSEAVGRLPALAAPLLEIGAENHARWEVRLFAS
jgi:urease accessory protein